MRAWWVRRWWKGGGPSCPRRAFTGPVPRVRPRRRVAGRLRGQAAAEAGDRGIAPAQAARPAGVSWPVAYQACARRADEVPARPAGPAAFLGIGEHRRGRPRWRAGEPGGYVPLAGRWHACFFGLPGGQGPLGQAEGRTAGDAAHWPARQPPAWRGAVRVAATGMRTIYASAVARMLPGAAPAAGLFHVVRLAVTMTGDARRRAARARHGRPGRSGNPGHGARRLPGRTAGDLSAARLAKATGTREASRHGQAAPAAWTGKEKPRPALNPRARGGRPTPREQAARDRLLRSHDRSSPHDDIPQQATPASTITR